jgi:ParB family chromosome partitioning protein
MGHARALIGSNKAEELAFLARDKQLSVREVERLVRRANAPQKVPRPAANRAHDPAGDADIQAVQRHLEEFLGLPVRIGADADPSSGTVTVRYATLDQLDLICQRLTGGTI